jgi:hypothetical protein
MSTRSLSSFEKNLFFTGWTLICIGIVCNEFILTKALSPDGIVEIQNRMAVWLFDIIFISLGLFCVKIGKFSPSRDVLRRLGQSYPRTFACSIGLSLTILLVVCAESIFYGLDYYQKENTVREVSWIRMSPPGEEGGVGKHPPQRVQGWTIADPFLGYTLPPNAQIADTIVLGGKNIYQATYTTDAYHRRITPIDHLEQRHNFLLFFGCSMTFGLVLRAINTQRV